MSKGLCSICMKPIPDEDAPILTMGGFGNPRCLCTECDADIECATRGTDPSLISASVKKIAENMSANQIEDPLTLRTVTNLLAAAASRREKIKDGTYDFALDDADDGTLEEIPEDMLESEEDKRLDEEEEERAKRIDSVLNWVWAGVLIGMVGFMVWWFFFR